MPKPLYSLLIFFLLCGGSALSQQDTVRIIELENLAWELRNSNLDTSILLGKQALELLNRLPDDNTLPVYWKEKNIARTYYYLGAFYREHGEPEMPFNYFAKALSISTSINDLNLQSQTLNGMGTTYLVQGKFPSALDNFLKALQIDEKRGAKKNICIDYANLGNVYDAQKNFGKALAHYNKALGLAEELKDKNRIAIQLGNIGIVYYEMHAYPKALEHFSKSLELNKELGNKRGVALALNNSASIYKEQGNYSLALDTYAEALKLAEEQGNTELIAACIGNVGVIYTKLKQYSKAEERLLKALVLSKEIKSLESIQEFEGAISELYTLTGRDKEALQHYKNFITARDSMTNLANIEKALQAEMNYGFEKQQAIDKAVHSKQVQLLEAENKSEKQSRLFLYAVIGLVTCLLFFARRAYSNKKRHAEFLASEGQRKELLLQEVHHRINNNLQFISGLLTLQANSAADEKLNGYLKQSQNRIESLSVLHELLYQKESQQEINMQEYLGKIVDFHREILGSKHKEAQIVLNVSEVNFPTKMALPLALIVNELITNSIKYAFTGFESGKIEVSLHQDMPGNKAWVLVVNDNGKGIPSGVPVNKESLGLRLVNLMAKQIGGVITNSGKPGANFSLVFNLPN